MNKIILIAAVLFVAAIGSSIYFYVELNQLKDNPEQLTQLEVKNLVAKVSELIVLPDGEDPTIATVNDLDKLKDQPFFARAKKGDKVLIYANARKAYLYDEANHKLVDVAPVNIGNQQAESVSPINSAEVTE